MTEKEVAIAGIESRAQSVNSLSFRLSVARGEVQWAGAVEDPLWIPAVAGKAGDVTNPSVANRDGGCYRCYTGVDHELK